MEVEEILYNGHSATYSGHFRIEATYHRIAYNYYWPRMHQDIENYIKACDVCQRKDKMKKNNPLHPIETRPPFEKIGIDLIRSLPITSNQNKYIVITVTTQIFYNIVILMIINHFYYI